MHKSSEKIVIADDEIHILRVLEMKLEPAGYSVLSAENGLQAWEIIEREKPDLVISDLQMPKLNGMELAERMKKHESLCRIPVILLTAKGFILHPDDLAEGNIQQVISKPFSLKHILSVVQNTLQANEKNLAASS